jgi:ketosteroid isomerase-like protein
MSLTKALQGLLVVTTLAACAPKEEEAPPPPEPMSQAGATAMRGAFVNLYMTKNPTGAAEFYADDAVMYSPDGTVATGKPAIVAAFENMIKAGQDSLHLSIASFEASGDQATEKGTWVMRTLDPQTKEASYGKGEYVVTYARQADGGFKIIKDSVYVPAGAPAQ